MRAAFSAAHALRHYKGKCERLHGHNYNVEISVEGQSLTPDTGLLMDFGDLKSLLRSELAPLDHSFLNELPPFDQINPSSENLARHIWHGIAPKLPGGVKLTSVTVSETPEQSATYSED
ncbi:MAG: 6-carboxytetrahydropterin synthase QueD [Desulfovibrionaceae bacterium]|nr:6-carboxytetrahydropterin synthase QueD [Desulfovibrionaceae bacterium]